MGVYKYGNTLSLISVGSSTAVSYLRQVLDHPTNTICNLTLRNVMINEQVLQMLWKLGTCQQWKRWNIINCPTERNDNKGNNNNNNNMSDSINIVPTHGFYLNLQQLTIQSTTHVVLVHYILYCPFLQSLRLDVDRFDATTLLSLNQMLQRTTTLKVLILDGSNVTDKVCYSLTIGLSSNTTLECLSFKFCKMSDYQVQILVQSLIGHVKLTKLNLCDNYCQEQGLYAIVSLLLHHQTTSLKVLDLSHHHYHHRLPLYILSNVFQTNNNTTLCHLSLSNSNLHDKDILNFMETLATTNNYNNSNFTTLQHLDISKNINLTEQALIYIGNMILPKLKLYTLNICKNKWNSTIAQAIMNGMRRNTTLCDLRLKYWRHVSFTIQIQYNLNANRGKRSLLQLHNNFPLSLWPLVLERIQQIHYFCPLQQYPILDNIYLLLHGPALLQNQRKK